MARKEPRMKYKILNTSPAQPGWVVAFKHEDEPSFLPVIQWATVKVTEGKGIAITEIGSMVYIDDFLDIADRVSNYAGVYYHPEMYEREMKALSARCQEKVDEMFAEKRPKKRNGKNRDDHATV